MIKKLLILFFIFISINSVEAVAKSYSFKNVEITDYISKFTYKIDYINPTSKINKGGEFYPGFRGNGQMILYTRSFGNQTGTNEYGIEAVIKNAVVEDVRGNNSYIPRNGFVLSGHGKAKKWIKENIKEGSIVRFYPETQRIESIIIPASYIFKAKKKTNKVKDLMLKRDLSNSQIDIIKIYDLLSFAESNIVKAEQNLQQKNFLKAKEYADIAEKYADNALYNSIDYIEGEFKGIWHRPVEKDRTAIIKTLERLKNTGIDNIFLETYYHGYTIFPSNVMKKYGFTQQRQEFIGFNPFEIWIEEAHKRDMKIHVWFQTFYCGGQDIKKNPNHIIAKKPSWANVQRRYYNARFPKPSYSEHRGYFLDPANPSVKIFLKELLIEISSNYEIDGINLDYIRYPSSLKPNFPRHLISSWGYSKYARGEFKMLYGVDPVQIVPNTRIWNKWIEYRQNKVTEFVSEVKDILNNKNITVSAVIFPNNTESKLVKMQNWKSWIENEYIDALTPLVLGSSEELMEDYLKKIKSSSKKQIKIYPGIFEPFTSQGADKMLYQIISARKNGAMGIVVFDSAHLDKEYEKALKTKVFTGI